MRELDWTLDGVRGFLIFLEDRKLFEGGELRTLARYRTFCRGQCAFLIGLCILLAGQGISLSSIASPRCRQVELVFDPFYG